MDEAQRLSNEGQALIDAAAEALGRYVSLMESTQAFEDLTIPDLLDRALNALSYLYPDATLLEMGRLGAREAERVAKVPVHDGPGVHFLVLNAVASAHFDPERFRDLLRETSRLCEDSSLLREVAAQPGALAGLGVSSRLGYEALATFETTLLRETDEKALMRRFIRFYGEFYEDVASPLLAWYNLLTGIKSQPYAKLIQNNATDLARNLTKHKLTASLLQDDGAHLRNASQHGNSFALEGEYVIFQLQSYQERPHRTEVIDRIYSFMESVLAMGWSLSNVLARLGIEVPIKDEDASYMNLTQFRLATLWLEHLGTTVVEADQKSTSWDLTLAIEPDETFSLAIALAENVPDIVSEVSVRAPGTATPMVIPLSAFTNLKSAQAAATAPVDHLLALVEFRAMCTVEGKSVLTAEDLRFAVATIGLLLIMKEDFTLIPYLRRVRQLTISHSLLELTETIKQVFALTRSPTETTKRQLAARLNEWRENSSAPTMPQAEAVTVRK
ncbi:hypothetical protein GCM10009861_11390 [Neomicrococcus aestuarii]